MSYTTIKIEGREIGLRFGYPCIRWFSEAGNKDYFDQAESLTEVGVSKLIQFAYQNDCLVKEVKPDISFEKFYDWVEERLHGEQSQELSDVLTIWANSVAVKRLVENSEKKRQEIASQQTSTALNESSTENLEYGPGNLPE